MKKLIKITTVFSFVMILFISGMVSANSGQSIALGHEFTALGGSAAIFSNPAFVNERDEKFILEANGQLSFWNNGINSKYLNKYLDQEAKDNILNNIDSDGLLLKANGSQDLKLLIGPVGVFAGLKENAQGAISSDIIEVILEGNEIGQEYELDGTDFSAGVYADTGVSFSYPVEKAAKEMDIKDFKIGGSFHYLYGAIYKATVIGNINVDYDSEEATGDLRLEYAEEAKGIAFDIGALFEIDDKITVGTSIMNLGSLKGVDPKYSIPSEDIEDEPMDKDLVYKLPRKFKVGANYKYRSNLDLFADYTLTSYDIGTTDHTLAGAVEYKPVKMIPLRLGANYSTLQNSLAFSGGMGLHLGPVHLDLGFSDLKSLFQNAKGVEAGLSVSLAF